MCCHEYDVCCARHEHDVMLNMLYVLMCLVLNMMPSYMMCDMMCVHHDMMCVRIMLSTSYTQHLRTSCITSYTQHLHGVCCAQYDALHGVCHDAVVHDVRYTNAHHT